MRIRAKPKKPIRKEKIKKEYILYGGENFKTISDYFLEEEIDFNEVIFRNPKIYCSSGWDEREEAVFLYYKPESDEEYSLRIKCFEEQLESYNRWFEKNKEKIKAEQQKREERKTKELKKDLEKYQKRLENLTNEYDRQKKKDAKFLLRTIEKIQKELVDE